MMRQLGYLLFFGFPMAAAIQAAFYGAYHLAGREPPEMLSVGIATFAALLTVMRSRDRIFHPSRKLLVAGASAWLITGLAVWIVTCCT